MAAPKVIQAAQVEIPTVSDPLREAAMQVAKVRKEVIGSLTFAEAMEHALTLATFEDVKARADVLASIIDDENAPIREKTLSSQLRKLATLAPRACAMFRFAVVSYQLSGRRCNPTQGAELAAKLPTLRKAGALKAGEITFGGIALPPTLGEF